jgi:hypothetical protein
MRGWRGRKGTSEALCGTAVPKVPRRGLGDVACCRDARSMIRCSVRSGVVFKTCGRHPAGCAASCRDARAKVAVAVLQETLSLP